MKAVESFRFLGTTISQDLKWELYINSLVKKAQQRLYFHRQLTKFSLPVIGSVLCTSCLVWLSYQLRPFEDYSGQSRLQTAKRIISTPFSHTPQIVLI